MITWAICWMVVKLGGAGEGIGILLAMSIIADLVVIGLVIEAVKR